MAKNKIETNLLGRRVRAINFVERWSDRVDEQQHQNKRFRDWAGEVVAVFRDRAEWGDAPVISILKDDGTTETASLDWAGQMFEFVKS